jgi:preprotein translocase subunit SecG
MDILSKIVYALMLLSAVGIVVLVLLQHGKGADMGTGFGAGASGSLFGATGSANFLSRSTAVLATLFFACTLALSWFASYRTKTAGPAGYVPGQIVPAAPSGPLPGALPATSSVPLAPAQGSVAPPPPVKSGEIPK